jgi:hypothetical protein
MKAHSIRDRNYSWCVDRPLAHTATVQSLPSKPFSVIMYPLCTYLKATEQETLLPQALLNMYGTSCRQNIALYHITEIRNCIGWSLPLFLPPTTANFSTSIVLCVNLPHERSFRISQDLCVGEVARRSQGSVLPAPVCFCILSLPLGQHVLRTRLTWSPVFKILLKSNKAVPSHEIATFGTPTTVSIFSPETGGSHLVSESCHPGELI